MINTFSEIIQAVRDDLSSDTTSSLYGDDIIKRAINRAYVKIGATYRWPELEDALITSTIANQEYYDYPSNWQPDSAWKLEVDGEDYGDPLIFKDYLYEKENNVPSGLDRMWSSQWRRFFIYPIPTTNGVNNITIWGYKTVDSLVNNTDKTIFSYSMPEVNEAIVLEAVALLKKKGESEQVGQYRSLEAKQIIAIAWGKITQNQAKYEKTTPFFNVPDFFGKSRVKSKIGKF